MDLSHIQMVKIIGGQLEDSYLDDGFLLAKKIGVGQPKRIENARVLVANTSLDTDKIKIPGTITTQYKYLTARLVLIANFSFPRPLCPALTCLGLVCGLPGARVRATGVEQVAEIEGAEREKMRVKVEKILAHNIKYV